MSEYDDGFEIGKLLAVNPQLGRIYLEQYQQQQAQKQQLELADALSQALGTGPDMSAVMPQQMPDQQMPQAMPQPMSYRPQQDFGLFGDHIVKAAQQTGLAPEEIYQIMQRESGGNPNAVSPTGPQGLMQLSKAAAIDVGLDPNDRFDPAKNIMAGAKYYRTLKDEFGDQAHLAYHDGPGAVRSGNISAAGRKYAAAFNPVSGQFDDVPYLPTRDISESPEYTATSKFLPSPVRGGRGLMGQDMDPVRRSYMQFIKQLVDSRNPMAIDMATKLMANMQDSSLKDIERTATQKDISWTNLVPGSKQFSDVMLRTMMKPAQQTNISMGGDRQPLTPMTDEQMAQFGLPTGPGHTKYIVDKSGMPQPVKADGGTEAQSKAAFYASNMQGAHDVLSNTQNNVDFTKLGVKHVINDIPWAGEFLASNYANPELSEDEQLFDNAVEQFVAGVNRSESGATVSQMEWSKARNRFIPGKGDKPEVIAQKAKNREMATRMMMESGGILGQSQLEQFDRAVEAAKNAIPRKSKETHTWVEDGDLPPPPKGYRLVE